MNTARRVVSSTTLFVSQIESPWIFFSCKGFSEEDAAHALALAARRLAVRQGTLVEGSDVDLAGTAALDHIDQRSVTFDRLSFPSFLGKDAWRTFVGEAAPAAATVTVVAEPALKIGALLADAPVVDGRRVRFLPRARVVELGGAQRAA